MTGDGSGFGSGFGSGDGFGYGSGFGSGYGDGSGSGSGSGNGDGYGDGDGMGSGSGYLELCKSLHPPVDSSLPVGLPQARRSGACIKGLHKWMLEHKIDSPSTVGQLWPLVDTDPWVMRILIEATRAQRGGP